MLKSGGYCYFVENNQRVVKAKIIKISGGFYTVLFDENSMTRIKRHRIFESYEEADRSIRRSPSKKTPYDFYY